MLTISQLFYPSIYLFLITDFSDFLTGLWGQRVEEEPAQRIREVTISTIKLKNQVMFYLKRTDAEVKAAILGHLI